MSQRFNRGTGLLIINVVNSNPNGDPDSESEPRIFEDGRGLISPVSFKRKLRDLMEEKGYVYEAALAAIRPSQRADILESRGRNRSEFNDLSREDFKARFWDGRVFGSTFLEQSKDEGKKKSKTKGKAKEQHIATGVVQFGPGVSVAPIEVMRLTLTSKAGVEDDKDRGMAPLAFRVVRHGLYAMPFFVNSSAAGKSGCDASDIDLMKFLIPHAYAHTASAMRPQVEIVHAWYGEHKSPLGSCPDSLILGALTPRKADLEVASTSLGDYDLPGDLPDELKARLASFEDLAVRDWSVPQAA
jgi:Cas7 group CRISPR-associated protein Csh2